MTNGNNHVRLGRRAFLKHGTLVLTAASLSSSKLLANDEASRLRVGLVADLHSETEEELVVYREDYGQRGLWVRPLAMFEETVEVDGQRLPRFRFVGEE